MENVKTLEEKLFENSRTQEEKSKIFMRIPEYFKRQITEHSLTTEDKVIIIMF